MRRTVHAADWWIACAVFVLPVVLFAREALGLRVFYHHDVQYYFYPYHKLVADIVARGELPLWNPYAFSGIPLLGDGQTAMFYPPNWLFFALSPIHALTLVIVLHFSIAGVGAYGYARTIGLGRLAGLAAALAFMFNGFLVARVVHLSIMAGAALIPLVFWGFERLLRRRTAGALLLAASAVALQALAGHPQIPIYTALALGIYALALIVREWRRRARWHRLQPLVMVVGMYGVGYGLAAMQLVPWIEFASFSPRAAGASFGFVTGQSLRAFDWLLFLFPYAYGGPRQSWLQSAPAWDLPVYLWERLGYIGILPLGFLLLGLAELRPSEPAPRPMAHNEEVARRDRLWALAAVLLVATLIAAGSSTPFGRLVYLLPAVGKLRAYARAIAVAGFAATLIGGYGVERLLRRASGGRSGPDRVAVAAAVVVLGATAGPLVVANLRLYEPGGGDELASMGRVLLNRGLQLHNSSAVVPLALAVASVLLLWCARRGLGRWTTIALVTVLSLDLLSFAASFNPTTDPAVFERTPDTVEFLRRDSALFRTASFVVEDKLPPAVAQAQLAISWAIAYGIEDINGFNSLQPRRYTDLLFGPDVEDVSYGFLVNAALLDPRSALLDMLNVKYAVVQPQTGIVPPSAETEAQDALEAQPAKWRQVFKNELATIYQNMDPLPRAWFPANVVAVADPATILTVVRAPDFDPRRTALVEPPFDAAQAEAPAASGAGRVETERVSPTELRLRTSTRSEQLLVLSEMWFPGWQAEIDGQRVPIHRVNYVLRGLQVPAGEHTIRLRYRPLSAVIGLGISTTTLLGSVTAIMIDRRRGSTEGRGSRPALVRQPPSV